MLVLAMALTVLAVAWTGWRALHDLEVLEHRLDLEPGPVVTPRLAIVEAPRAYSMFRQKNDGAIKIVLEP